MDDAALNYLIIYSQICKEQLSLCASFSHVKLVVIASVSLLQ